MWDILYRIIRGTIDIFSYDKASRRKLKQKRSEISSRELLDVFFYLSIKYYYRFWAWATKYYPFSLFYKDRLFHFNNQPIDKFMIKMQSLIRKQKIQTSILRGEFGDPFLTFYGTFVNKSDNTPKSIELINQILQEKLGTVYVRKDSEGFRVLVPTQFLY